MALPGTAAVGNACRAAAAEGKDMALPGTAAVACRQRM